ncbi:MAG: hypothetical protein FWB91_00370 [Defluviitaleaceae bacterium]|nr:hypothetical protein [Defluviitaleaceae bacterium]
MARGLSHDEVQLIRSDRDKGYVLLADMEKLLDKFEKKYTVDMEWELLGIVDRVLHIERLSPYQISLALKRFADCSFNHGQKGLALEMYLEAARLNKNLPIKRRIKKLQG